jgi:hypothetical protein
VVACAVAAIGDLDQVFDLAGLAVPPTMEYLRVMVMRPGPARPDGAVAAGHVAAGALHLLAMGIGLLVDHLEVATQLGDELLARHRTGAPQ